MTAPAIRCPGCSTEAPPPPRAAWRHICMGCGARFDILRQVLPGSTFREGVVFETRALPPPPGDQLVDESGGERLRCFRIRRGPTWHFLLHVALWITLAAAVSAILWLIFAPLVVPWLLLVVYISLDILPSGTNYITCEEFGTTNDLVRFFNDSIPMLAVEDVRIGTYEEPDSRPKPCVEIQLFRHDEPDRIGIGMSHEELEWLCHYLKTGFALARAGREAELSDPGAAVKATAGLSRR